MNNTFLEFGLAQIKYSGINIGSFLEIEIDDNNGKVEHLYFEGLNPTINGGYIPGNPGSYRGGSINELIDYRIVDNTTSVNYTPNYTFKARFIDDLPYIDSNAPQTVSSSYTVVDDYYNLSKTCTFDFGGGSNLSQIELTFYFNCWVFPNKKTFKGYKYSGPLEDFDQIKSCICSLETHLAPGNLSALNDLTSIIDELRLSLVDLTGVSINKPTSICDQIDELSIVITNEILNTQIDNSLESKKIEVIEGHFSKLLAELRDLLWRFSSPEFGCIYPNFETRSQKGNLYIQAIGNDAMIGSVYEGMPQGVFLRWAFQTGHIPKGRLKVQNYGPFTPRVNSWSNYFKNDYTYIFRTLYTGNEKKTVIDSLIGAVQIQTNATEYNTALPFRSPAKFKFTNSVALSLFHQNSVNNSLFELFSFYNDFIEIEFENLCFAFEIDFTVFQNCTTTLKIETISKNLNSNEEYISSRKSTEYIAPNIDLNQTHRVENDSIKRVRIQFIWSSSLAVQPPIDVTEIRYETYDDFEGNTPIENWDSLGNHSMSINDELVLNKRLNDSNRGITIDQKWPRFIDNVLIKNQNYVEKWLGTNSDPGIKGLLLNYLRDKKILIENSTEGYSDEFPVELNQFVIDIEQAIKYTLTDYHFARMLGMGYIDNTADFSNGKRYIYKARYSTKSNFSEPEIEQVYLTLPTGLMDSRPPFNPSIEIDFGFEDCDCDGKSDFDENGYSKFEKRRLVNFSRSLMPHEKAFTSFYQFNDQFDLGKNTTPLLLGVNFTPPTGSSYIFNSITNYEDNITDYKKTGPSTFEVVRETQPIINKLGKVFSHQHLENGTYQYGFYGIDWFGKFPPTLPSSESITTEFTFTGLLKPPVQLHCHYIQHEETPFLSTPSEQSELNTRNIVNPEGDNVFTRLKFGVNHIHKINFQTATHVEVFVRTSPIGFVQGKITEIIDNGASAELSVENYGIFSGDVVGSSNLDYLTQQNSVTFEGSQLITESGSFEVINVVIDGSTTKINVKKKGELMVNQSNMQVEKYCIYHTPKVSEKFSLEENWSKIDSTSKLPNANWQLLSQLIPLIDLDTANNNIEEINGEGFKIGGYLGEAISIEKIPIPSPPDENTNILENYYRFTIDFILPQHNQSNVTWSGGLLRVYNDNEALYDEFEVLAFETNGSNTNHLDLYILDSSNFLGNLPLNASVLINFHPYYKVYLEPENGLNRIFNQSNILPTNEALTKESYLAFRTVYFDNSGSPSYNNNFKFSALSVPIPLIAFAESKVYKQEPLQGSLFTTRPDYYGNSSYTIDLEVGINGKPIPFSLVYYRTTWLQAISQLYDNETISAILEAIKLENISVFANQIMADVLNAEIYEGINLKTYGSYTIVEPNKNIWGAEGKPINIDARKSFIKSAIEKSFISIHEQPIVFQFIINEGTQTSNSIPVIRKDGQLISYSNNGENGFNPFPFCCKFISDVNQRQVIRFTDYKVPGSSNDLFFYQVKELGIRNNLGIGSYILGPVYPRNSFPPPAPVIDSFEIIPGNFYLDTKITVKFEVSKPLETNKITSYKLYRTNNQTWDGKIAKMKLVGDFLSGEIIEDNFSDFQEYELPYDLKFYYRVVAVRNLIIPDEPMEEILSEPSNGIELQLFDNINPIAPEIEFSCNGHTGVNLNQVVLNFERKTYKGKYYLYELNTAGNWALVNHNNFTNPLVNIDNEVNLNFNLGDVAIKDEDDKYLYKRYKITVENVSGLLNLKDNEFGLTNYFVPDPYLIGPKVNCLNQPASFKVIKSKDGNTIQWIKDGVVFAGNVSEISTQWSSLGEKSIIVTEFDPISNITIQKETLVLVKSIPTPLISGEVEVLVNTPEAFETNMVNGNYYLWESEDPGTIFENQGSNSVLATLIHHGVKQIKVTESNGGCSQVATLNVSSYDFQFNGNIEPQINIQELYQVLNIPGFTYQWQIEPSFGTIIGASNQSDITINWGISGTTTINLIIVTILGKQFELNFDIVIN